MRMQSCWSTASARAAWPSSSILPLAEEEEEEVGPEAAGSTGTVRGRVAMSSPGRAA
jgi:hypothetical protein